MPLRKGPPASQEELLTRARALTGRTLGAIAEELRMAFADDPVHAKGKPGELLERALGATGGSRAEHDFPSLAIELKSIPTDERGAPRESTYVCKIQLDDADSVEWEDSWTRRKLSRVLFVPVVTPDDTAMLTRVVGVPVLFVPTAEEERVLRADYEDAMGLVALGRVEELTAHTGTWLQVRPKARDGSARTLTFGPEREAILAMPRGFYLRPSFTAKILSERR
jgi:DNA mismatch repair protein MutH